MEGPPLGIHFIVYVTILTGKLYLRNKRSKVLAVKKNSRRSAGLLNHDSTFLLGMLHGPETGSSGRPRDGRIPVNIAASKSPGDSRFDPLVPRGILYPRASVAPPLIAAQTKPYTRCS